MKTNTLTLSHSLSVSLSLSRSKLVNPVRNAGFINKETSTFVTRHTVCIRSFKQGYVNVRVSILSLYQRELNSITIKAQINAYFRWLGNEGLT